MVPNLRCAFVLFKLQSSALQATDQQIFCEENCHFCSEHTRYSFCSEADHSKLLHTQLRHNAHSLQAHIPQFDAKFIVGIIRSLTLLHIAHITRYELHAQHTLPHNQYTFYTPLFITFCTLYVDTPCTLYNHAKDV